MPIKIKDAAMLRVKQIQELVTSMSKVLNFLLNHPDEAYTINELARELRMRDLLTARAIGAMKALGIIDAIEIKGRSYFYISPEAYSKISLPLELTETTKPHLSPEIVQRRRELTEKLQRRGLSREEAEELITILEFEIQLAIEENEWGAVIAALMLKALTKMAILNDEGDSS
ncbi:hypothetical protein JCM16138_16070 [Thermococcus atlanticus]